MYKLNAKNGENADNRGKVLIVDDSVDAIAILKKIMESLHFRTETAKDGKEAVMKYLLSKPYEYTIIFMDNIMPLLTGIDATKIIRLCERADSKVTPIVSISSEMSEKNIKEYELAGYNEWLCKPINIERLTEVINKYSYR